MSTAYGNESGLLGRSVQLYLRMVFNYRQRPLPSGRGHWRFPGYSGIIRITMSYIYRVLREGPSGLWSMDSQPLTDSSGYDRDATFTGTPRTTRPIIAGGIAAQLLGAGATISYPIDNIMIRNREASSFTLEAWLKPAHGNTKILARNNSGLFLDGLKLRFTVDIGAGYSIEYKNLVAGNIYHVVAIYDGSGIYLFLNGEKVAGSDIDAGAFVDTAATLSSSTSSSVVLDSIATYSYALPASAIVEHYALGVDYPSVTTLSAINGGNHYDFIDQNVGVYSRSAFPVSQSWAEGLTDVNLAIVDDQLVNLYDEVSGQYQSGTWTYQESIEIDAATIVGSRILWRASDDITVEMSETGEDEWVPLTNGGQIVSNRDLTSGYSASIRVTIPESAQQIAVEYLSVTFYSSLDVRGSDEDLTATILNPVVTLVAEAHTPAASFNDNAGITFTGAAGGLSIPQDDVFGGYFAIEMTVKVDANANNATILYVDAASGQPKITTDASGKWVFTNLTALYVNGAAISSGASVAPGEWHHVLAVFPETLATVYVGNNKAGTAGYPMRIGHLATYSESVSAIDAQTIYRAWTGAPSVQIAEPNKVSISESSGQVFKAYSYDWAIVTGG